MQTKRTIPGQRTKVFLLIAFSLTTATSGAQRKIDFIADTQQPLFVEKIIHHPNHNTKATSLLLADILLQRPAAVYMLGDVVALASSNHKWSAIDKFLDSCRTSGISCHALLGNHDLMWCRRKGESNFQRRFPDHIDTGYVSIIDSIAVVLLNSNFKKLSSAEINRQEHWYTTTLNKLNSEPAVRTIIVCCHHSPWSNSRVVGSSLPVQNRFVPAFISTPKCSLFISGHAHAFEHFTVSGKDFLVIGGGGGIHQPLDTSATRLPDIASAYKPMFHYLTLERKSDTLFVISRFLKSDFSGIESGYSIRCAPIP
jgi:hypothetical protein